MRNIIDPKEIHLISEGMLLSILAANDNENDSMSVHIPILTLIQIFNEYEEEELRRMAKRCDDETKDISNWCKRELELEAEIQELRELIPGESKDNGKKLPNFEEFKRIKLAEKNAKKL
jgi:hypothetical protein